MIIRARHFVYKLSPRIMVVAAAFLALVFTGCSVSPNTIVPTLEPPLGSITWPQAPDIARYSFGRMLVGEKDFLAPGEERRQGLGNALRWIAGLVFGEPEYFELRRPVSGLTDNRGWIYVVDASHKAIVVFNMAERRIDVWRNAAVGQLFVSPVAIAEDGSGGFLVTDSELAEVIRLNKNGEPVGRFGKGVLARPTGITRDPRDNVVYVADTREHNIKAFSLDGKLIDVLGSPGKEMGRFNSPTYLTFRENQLYVADTLNFRVQVLNRGGDGRFEFGQTGLFVGNMTRPKGIAVGGGSRIYVVESYFDYLLVFDQGGELLLPIGGTGAEPGRFYLPSGVWTDKLGHVFVADMFNGRVVVFKELTTVQGG